MVKIGETAIVLCKVCRLPKPRKKVSKNKYISETSGKEWHYTTCPDCMVRTIDKATKRKCRDCSKYLPASRYFKCYICQPELPDIDDDFIYESDYFDDFTEKVFIEERATVKGGLYGDFESKKAKKFWKATE